MYSSAKEVHDDVDEYVTELIRKDLNLEDKARVEKRLKNLGYI